MVCTAGTAELLAQVEIRELVAARAAQRRPVPESGREQQLLQGLTRLRTDGSWAALRRFRLLVARSVYATAYDHKMSTTAQVYERIIRDIGARGPGQPVGPTPWPVTAESLLVFAVIKMLGKGHLPEGGRCQAETVRKYLSGLRRTSARVCPSRLLSDEAYKDVQLMVAALGRRVDSALPIQATPLDSATLDRLIAVVDWGSAYERECVLVAVWSRAMGARTSELRRWVGRMDVFDSHPASLTVLTMRFGDRKWARSGMPLVVPILGHPDRRRCLLTLLASAAQAVWGCSWGDALRHHRHERLFTVDVNRYVATLRNWGRRAGCPDAQFFQAGSGRSGLATDLIRAGVPVDLTIQLTDHSGPAGLKPYVRRSATERVAAAAVAQSGRQQAFASFPASAGPPQRRR